MSKSHKLNAQADALNRALHEMQNDLRHLQSAQQALFNTVQTALGPRKGPTKPNIKGGLEALLKQLKELEGHVKEYGALAKGFADEGTKELEKGAAADPKKKQPTA